MAVPNLAEKLAAKLLARDGISAIWQLHVAAAAAHADGYRHAAETVLEIAEAAERTLLEAAPSIAINQSVRNQSRELPQVARHSAARFPF
jgi:hypothetical protein